MKRGLLFGAAVLLSLSGAAQPADTAAWTLEECIACAQQNSIDVGQRTIEAEQRSVELHTARNSRLPSLDVSLGSDIYFGRGPGRDGIYQDNTQLSGSVGASTAIPLFEGFRIRHQIAGRRLEWAAAVQDLARAREDIALRVTALYLQVLLTRELVGVAEQQVALSRQQAERSRELVASGKNPESARYESEALVAKDELTLTQSRSDLRLALLDLSQAMNRPSAEGFDVRIPRLDALSLESMSRMRHPAEVYATAVEERPSIRAAALRVESSEAALRMARAARYPQIQLRAGYGNSVYHQFNRGAQNTEFWTQLGRNGNEYIGLSIGIPIFNRLATRNQIRSSTLSIRSQQLSLTDAQRTLRKEIEQAFVNAQNAYARYRSAERALSSAQIAFRYADELAAAGRSTIFDFSDAKNRMERAASESAQARYDYIFRSKILDFYGGVPLAFGAYEPLTEQSVGPVRQD